MRLTTWIVGIPVALVAIWIALANRQPVVLSLDPFSQDAPALTVQMPLYLLVFLAILAGVLLGGFAIGARRAARLSAELADSASAKATALLPARLRKTKTPAE
ncbi:MAG: DUF1049 domain-containing protein [Alphaproteobacteria bacterium]|nr:DUF1049 domain-containing protein [Alphaproteobacteria bacterium]MBV9419358.1 DUF1049 domain-containing protein [Alphaproteobacteria bacterium]MBV9540753.1 DUF1049 domain-containing protein [Alphaproteobacteria bacterium]MBV9903585.1 DUF1049 domain-containing protein [Alphaproteobacteria bacterium]